MSKSAQFLEDLKNKTSDEVFLTYMELTSKSEGEEIYRMLPAIGSGIMRHTHIAKGIELVYTEMDYYNPCFQSERKEYDVIEVMYIYEGHAEFELMNRQFASGQKGDVLIFNSQTSVKKTAIGKEGMRCMSLVLFADDSVDFLNGFLDTNEFHKDDFFHDARTSDSIISFTADEALENHFYEMIKLPGEYSKHHVKLATVQAILLLLQNHSRRRRNSNLYFSGTTGKKVQQVRKMLSTNLEENISIEKLAELSGLNRTTMQKVFKEMYGTTINEYRTQTRIQEAKNLLVTTKLSITEIAGRCGYTNASKFSDVFKRITGTLPRVWREMK